MTENCVPSLDRAWDDDAYSAMLDDVTARMRKTPREVAVEAVLDTLCVGLGILESAEDCDD